MTPSGQAAREGDPAAPPSAEAAVALLVSLASGGRPGSPDAARAAAAVVRGALGDLESLQADLTAALVASQDRLLAMRALTKVSFHDVAGDEAIRLLLARALGLTDASAVLLLDEEVVAAVSGDPPDVDALAEVARRAVVSAPEQSLRTVAGDTAIIGSLDTDTDARWHVAYFRRADRPFATTDLPLVEAIGSTLGVLLAFAELHRRELRRATVAREHELASVLAQSVITDEPPASATLDLYARTVPASLTGGDFYVFGQTGEAVWFAVGDVAGKGLPAAMLMTRAVAACRVAFLAHSGGSAAEVFARVEDEVYDHLDRAGVFLTLAVGAVREGSGTVSLVNAGHSPVVHVRDGVARTVAASVPPLGTVRHRTPRTATFTLGGDDCLVVGSDGLVEQEDQRERMFGYDRFSALCRRCHTRPAAGVGEDVFAEVAAFAGGAPPADDATLVVVKLKGVAR